MVFCDITEHRLAEKSLKESEEQLRSLADSIPNLAWWANSDGYITWYNRRWYEYTGTTPEEMEGWGWQSVHDPSALPRVMEQWLKSITTGLSFDMVFPLRGSDGVYRTFLTRSFPMKDSRGNVIRWFGTNTDISALKDVEEKLKESLERHRLLAETMLQGVVHQDANGKIISMNPAAELILGKTRDQFIGNTSDQEEHDCIRETGEAFPGTEHPSMVALRTGQSVRGVIMGIFNPQLDEYRWISIDAVPVFRSGEAVPSEVYAIFGDITERRYALEALKDSEDRLQFALETIHTGAWDLNLGDHSSFRSIEHDNMFGYPDLLPEWTYEMFLEHVVPEDRETVNNKFLRAMESQRDWDFECRIRRADGELRWIWAAGRHRNDNSGVPCRLAGIVQDITERKQAEDELLELHTELENRVKERTAELATSIENLQKEIAERAIAEQSLFRVNRLYAVLSETNQSIVKITNRTVLFSEFCRIAVEHGGFLLAWVGLVDEESSEVRRIAVYGKSAYLDDIRLTAAEEPEGEGPTGFTIRNGTYCICNDFQNDPCTRPWHERGKVYGINSSAGVALKEGNRVIGVLTLYSGEKNYFDKQQVELLQQMGMDISYALDNLNREEYRKDAEQALYLEATERLKTVEALREKEKMLIQQNRQAAMGEMIGNIAHQWRQPLNTLGLYTQKLGIFYGSPSFNKEFLDNSIAKSMDIIMHMSKTIDDFRNYFKPEKEKADFYVIGAIKSALSLLEGNFNNPKITIDFVEHDHPVINGYQNEFAQVFLNIMNNARDAMIERGIADGRIIIKIYSENNCAVVTVADNAGGIPDEVINKVFDPYFTTKGPQVGTGIGLFMSKTIIEKNMGGRLTVYNTDVGAEFRIVV